MADLQKVLQYFSNEKDLGSSYHVTCPCHDDQSPSLHITPTTDGRILLYCPNKCDRQNILDIVGLTWNDLYPKSKNYPYEAGKGKVVAEYSYVAEEGEVLYVIQKWANPKGFSAYRYKKGKKIGNVKGVRRILYHLPEVLTAEDVFICEGEKTVDAIRSLGVTATCNPFGSGAWKDQYSESLEGKNVYILPDEDAPGMEFAYRVAGSVYGLASIKIVCLPNLGFKQDPEDWVRDGGTLSDLWALVRETLEYVLPEDIRKFSNGGWFRSHNYVLKDPNLRSRDKMVLMVLYMHADTVTQTCYPATPTIAREAGIPRYQLWEYTRFGKTSQGILSRLVQEGYVKIGKKKFGTRLGNLYTLLSKESFG